MKIDEISKSILYLSITAVIGLTLDGTNVAVNNIKPTTLPQELLTNTDMSNTLAMLNRYETNIPYIAISNGRIHSGLYERDWSIAYQLEDNKHELGILFGTEYGVYYRYNIYKDFTAGGQITTDGDKVNAVGSIGWRF